MFALDGKFMIVNVGRLNVLCFVEQGQSPIIYIFGIPNDIIIIWILQIAKKHSISRVEICYENWINGCQSKRKFGHIV